MHAGVDLKGVRSGTAAEVAGSMNMNRHREEIFLREHLSIIWGSPLYQGYLETVIMHSCERCLTIEHNNDL